MKRNILLLLLCAICVQVNFSCAEGIKSSFSKTIKGDGNVVTKSYTFESFSKISYGGKMNVEYRHSDSQNSLKITTDQNILDALEIKCEKGELIVEPQKNNKHTSINIEPTECTVIIESTALNEINGAANNTLTVSTPLSGNSLDMNFAAGSKANFNELNYSKLSFNLAAGSSSTISNSNTKNIDANIAAGGSITINGEATDCEINIAAGGTFSGYGLKVNNVECSIAAGGTAEVYATDDLNISIAAGGSVYYKGDPKLTKDVVGGKVKKMD